MKRLILRQTRSALGQRHAGLISLLLALALAGFASVFLQPSERVIEGKAYVVDGDTIRIGENKIRLKGIDAPELSQPCMRAGRPYLCGEKTRDALIGMIISQKVECRLFGRDRYQRQLARCFVNGEDIGAKMVAEGHAVAYGDYRLLEAQARLRSAGIWASEFERPHEWRRRNAF
ncbi:thermonuclease family protein [Microvirga sp. 2TAF3]|uniref:thermonuclease family protein n=1 Tax=Microvirga sp. 2TAF3 TaxID=3233014 RepID=UPI003F959F26